ncbi:MAG: 4Fe-4S dicluster domain-containing protein [Phycisphaeraceae bacterium]
MADKNDKKDEKKSGRRGFFRQLFLGAVEKVEEAGKKFADQMNQLNPEKKPAYTPAYDPYDYRWDGSGTRYLRPPGALAAPAFSDTCSRCGDCVKACPAQAIKLDEEHAGGLPYIVARESPCVVCTDLSCMKVCPTGALRKLDGQHQIQMGYAVTDQSRCLRGGGFAIYEEPTSITGEDCQLCVTQCPIGSEAIAIDNHGTVEVRHGCIGCGVCEQVCPTDPPSVWVEPW